MRRILIVDDGEINRIILKKILGNEYDIIEAENGKEALLQMHKNYKSLSAVILDIIMPEMDGFEVLKNIQDNLMLSQIPVIVATNASDEGVKVKALSLGANDFISKPYNGEILKHCLRNNIKLRETASIVNAIQKDKLTGIYSREAFFEKTEGIIRGAHPDKYIMACFDVDNFKLINDQYGAKEGDRILKVIGRQLKETMDKVGGICSRISADNFAALYPNTKEIVNTVTTMMDTSFIYSEAYAGIFTSIGRYVVNDMSLSASALYDRAYIAKKSIKGLYDKHIAYFDESMREALLREQEIITEMDKAIAEEQFEVWYQPQINHSTGAIIGAEALVRWRHPHRGLISPGLFVPVFEENGFIYPLDKYVWEQVCKRLNQWIKAGKNPLPISVNVSRYDIFKDDLISVITGLIDKYEIPVNLLRLEITESAFAESSKQIIGIVKQLKEIGFTIEIDDFGSGYSSLNTLKDVPADIVKLDMKFVEGEGNSKRGGNILQSIIRMVKWLNMECLAEGVETTSQANFLKSIGCSYVQGYLYAKPMPVEEYEHFVKSMSREFKLHEMETVEHLNSDTFWDPNSLETLVFNSYIGAACVYEYAKGKISMLRANDKFLSVFNSSKLTIDDILSIDWMKHLDKHNKRVMNTSLKGAISSHEEVNKKIMFINIPGCEEEVYFNSNIRVIATSEDKYLIYCTLENITEQHKAENAKKKANDQLSTIMSNIRGGVTSSVLVDGEPKIIFANDQYYAQLGYTKEEYHKTKDIEHKIMFEEDIQQLRELYAKNNENGEPVSITYRIIRKDGEIRWVENNVTSVQVDYSQERVLMAVINDVTEAKVSEIQLRESNEQNIFLNEIGHHLLEETDASEGIKKILERMREYFDSERAYVFEYNFDEKTTSNTYEVCAPEVHSEINNLQGIPLNKLEFWLYAFDQQDILIIENVDELDEKRPEKKLLMDQGIKSLIAVPLVKEGENVGFIGVDDPKAKMAHVDRIKALGNYVSVMITRRDLSAKIHSDNELLLELMKDTPGGFVRMQVKKDGQIIPLYFNDGFCKMVDMTVDELFDIYSNDSRTGVHQDDISIVEEFIANILENNQGYSKRYRIRKGKDDYLWVMIFGRKTINDRGEVLLNIYYTDATEQNKEEAELRELLDNIPCGAALFEFDNGKVSAAHLNKKYMELVNRTGEQITKADALQSVHPDDKEQLLNEIFIAMKEERDIEIDLRILCGSQKDKEVQEYKSFHISGTVVVSDEGKCMIYAVYSSNEVKEASYQEMLPVALNAIMRNTSNLTFVKDRKFRYICCSKSYAKVHGFDEENTIVGKSDFDIIKDSEAKKYLKGDEKVLKSKKPIFFEEMSVLPNGEKRFMRTTKYPLMDAFGKVIGIYAVISDETETHSSLQRLKMLSDNIPGGIASLEVFEDNARVVYCNEGILEFAHMSAEEYEEKSVIDPLFLLVDEDKQIILDVIEKLRNGDNIIDNCRFRCLNYKGEYKWFSMKGSVTDRTDLSFIMNLAVFDITRQKLAEEKLNLSNEQFRIAASVGNRTIARYVLKTNTLYHDSDMLIAQGFGKVIQNALDSVIAVGIIEPDSVLDFVNLKKEIEGGKTKNVTTVSLRVPDGTYHWFRLDETTFFDSMGNASEAMLVFTDITDEREKEIIYNKWQQSLNSKKTSEYTLFHCNISKNASFDLMEGELLNIVFSERPCTFNERTIEYATHCVVTEDQEDYIKFLDSDALLAGYFRGQRKKSFEYREKLDDEKYRWLRVTTELVEYPHSKDIKAYLLYENIDKEKRKQIAVLKLAESDPLTKALNRNAFAERIEQFMKKADYSDTGAFLMLDLDGFKLVNDVFGHAVGDDVLIDVVDSINAVIRKDDLVARLGGDEFLVFLKNANDNEIIGAKAEEICSLVRRSFSSEICMSVSIGITIFPRDGKDFESLYKKADTALYHVKGKGKDGYAFYHDKDEYDEMSAAGNATNMDPILRTDVKRRMLIVDDNLLDFKMLASVFKDDFNIEKAPDGNAALVRLRHYGEAVSVVLLDLLMPRMNGFEVLRKMKSSQEMRNIPVVIVTSSDDMDSCLRATREGATDYVTKPIDPNLLRTRVFSAVSKAENDKKRAQSNLLQMQNDEASRYKLVLHHLGTFVIEHDWVQGTFIYDPEIESHIAGVYDSRKLWRILLSDMVTDTATVRKMQEHLHNMAEDHKKSEGELMVQLKTPAKSKHWFKMNIYKMTNEFDITDKLIMTFKDMGKELPADYAE